MSSSAKKPKKTADEAKSKKANDRQLGTHPSRDLKEYVGRYENPGYGAIQISLAGEDLTLKLNNLSGALHHFHYDVFQVPEDSESLPPGMKFQFALDLSGRVAKISAPLQPGLEAIEFTRTPNP